MPKKNYILGVDLTKPGFYEVCGRHWVWVDKPLDKNNLPKGTKFLDSLLDEDIRATFGNIPVIREGVEA